MLDFPAFLPLADSPPALANDAVRTLWTASSHRAMLDRCFNPRSKNFKHYGARGIVTDPSWHGKGGLMAFCGALISSGVGLRPSLDHSLARLDDAFGYSIGNIAWILNTPRSKNRRGCYFIQGKCAAEAARDAGQPAARVLQRLHAGHSGQDALCRPSKNDHEGLWQSGWATPGYIASRLGLSRVRVWQLMNDGTLPAENQTKIPGGKPRWWVRREVFEAYLALKAPAAQATATTPQVTAAAAEAAQATATTPQVTPTETLS